MVLLAKLVSLVTTLSPALPQSKTNGASQLGSLSASTLPNYMTNNPMPNGYAISKLILNATELINMTNTIGILGEATQSTTQIHIETPPILA
jgi:hypothetical protein